MHIPCINLIALFIIKKSSDIFQCFCNCASNSGRIALLLRTATTLDTVAALFFHRETVACSYFSKTFPSQYIADINGPCHTRDVKNSLDTHIMMKQIQIDNLNTFHVSTKPYHHILPNPLSPIPFLSSL